MTGVLEPPIATATAGGSSAMNTNTTNNTSTTSLSFRSRSYSADLAAEGGLTSSDPVEVREWLSQHSHRKQTALLDKFLIELRRGRLSNAAGAGTAGTGTTTAAAAAAPLDQSASLLIAHRIVNLLRHMIGSTNWKSAAELLCLLRGLGRELQQQSNSSNAVGTNTSAIGNVVRRIMAAVREETEAAQQEDAKRQGGAAAAAAATSGTSTTAGRLSLESMLWALPQHVRAPSGARTTTAGGGGGGGSSTSIGGGTVGGTSGNTSGGSSGKHHHHHASDTANRDAYERQESALEESAAQITEENNSQQQVELFPPHYYQHRPELKQAVMEAIQEIWTDMEDLHKNIEEQATNHIHTGEVILTAGKSKTIELFLKAAAKSKRTFQVIVVMCGNGSTNSTEGTYEMAKQLASTAGIETTMISESAVFAVMARVHKVLLPAHAVLANGGLVASASGSNLIAIAAKHHSVPVQCVTGLFKLCPKYPHEGQDTLNDLLNPRLITTATGSAFRKNYKKNKCLESTDPMMKDVEVVNPVHDYIEPKHIGLYITNVGSFQPSFIYRMLAENYHADDWDSFE